MEAFHEGIYARVADGMKVETIRLKVVRVIWRISLGSRRVTVHGHV